MSRKSNRPFLRDLQAAFSLKAHNLGAGGVNNQKYSEMYSCALGANVLSFPSKKRRTQRAVRQNRAMGRLNFYQ